MADIGGAISGVGAAVGLFDDEDEDAANAANRATANAAASSAAASNKLAAISQDQWNQYKKLYTPVETQFAKNAVAGVKPDYVGIDDLSGMAVEDVARQFDIARATDDRNMARRGIALEADSDSLLDRDRDFQLQEALARAGAITRAKLMEADAKRTERKYAREQTQAQLAQAVNAGRGTAGTATSTLSAAGAGSSSLAGMWSGIANDAQNRADQKNQGVGAGLADLSNLASQIISGGSSAAATPAFNGNYGYNTSPAGVNWSSGFRFE